jgi:integrase/recombinase XerD
VDAPDAGRPIERYFRRGCFRRRLRASLLDPYWDGFIGAMEQRGYQRYTIYRSVEIALPFAEYAAAMGISVHALGDAVVERYLEVRCYRESSWCLRHVVDFLRERGVLHASATRRASTSPALVIEYQGFLRDHRGISDDRAALHGVHVAAFLKDLGRIGNAKGIRSLTPAAVHAFIVGRADKLSRSDRKTMCTALRGFLRFLLVRGYLRRDLVSCVPVIPSFKLDRLPRGIDWDGIQRILAVIDRSTPVGCRDYAMLLLLATYGMRVGQLCSLRLDDVDWRRQTIRIRAAKGGKDTILPLRKSVGEALINYLRHARPRRSYREIFLRIRAPLTPMRHVSAQIRPYARKAGVPPPFGAHAWRHACATRMLAKGQSLKTIRDILGHRSIESTFIYAKVDVEMLRQAALEWPAVSP